MQTHAAYSASNYLQHKILKILQHKSFPQLLFDKPKRQNQSKLLYVRHATVTDVLDISSVSSITMPRPMLSQSLEETLSISPLTPLSRHDNELDYSSLQLKQAIVYGHSFSSNWAPSSTKLSINNDEDCVLIDKALLRALSIE